MTFALTNAARWEAAITKTFDGTPPPSLAWTDQGDMIDTLEAFMGRNMNHARLPGGGSFTFEYGGEIDTATGDVLFGINGGRICRCRLASMRFAFIEERPLESFFLIDLGALEPIADTESPVMGHEWSIEYAGHIFSPSASLDDLEAYRAPGDDLPVEHCAVPSVRLLGGKLLVVSKVSHWNRAHKANDNSHETMLAAEIRDWIEARLEPVVA